MEKLLEELELLKSEQLQHHDDTTTDDNDNTHMRRQSRTNNSSSSSDINDGMSSMEKLKKELDMVKWEMESGLDSHENSMDFGGDDGAGLTSLDKLREEMGLVKEDLNFHLDNEATTTTSPNENKNHNAKDTNINKSTTKTPSIHHKENNRPPVSSPDFTLPETPRILFDTSFKELLSSQQHDSNLSLEDDDDLSLEVERLSAVEAELRETLDRSISVAPADKSRSEKRALDITTEHDKVDLKQSASLEPMAKNSDNVTMNGDNETQVPYDVPSSEDTYNADHDELIASLDRGLYDKTPSLSFSHHSARPKPQPDYGIQRYPCDHNLPTIPLPLSRSDYNPAPFISPTNNIPLTSSTTETSPQSPPLPDMDLESMGREYLFPPPNPFLDQSFHHLSLNPNEKSLRACYITIRPDILCGAVMDAVTHAVEIVGGVLTKRQGGHLRAALGEIGLDAQLCAKRTSRDCERVLLVRIVTMEEKDGFMEVNGGGGGVVTEEEEDWIEDATRFWVGYVEKDVRVGDLWPIPNFSPTKKEVVVTDSRYPSLDETNGPLVKMGWRVIVEIIQELETRDLAYCTITTAPFGAFPSLPTLDAHYCSQLRHLSRENMIHSTLRTAKELESFAAENEHKCNNLTKLLHKSYKRYEIQPPILPEKKPLCSYELKYEPPEELHPPWGKRVHTALEQVSQSSSITVKEAVHLVLTAFQRQDDEEMTARLSRKNVQVMDRLNQIQEYKRGLLLTLRLAYGNFPIATRAAKEFHKMTHKYCPHHDDDDDGGTSIPRGVSVRDCVPLLKTNVLLASPRSGYTNTTASCIITSHQIFINIPTIPLLGFLPQYSKHLLFSIHQHDFEMWEMDPKFHGMLYLGEGFNPNGVKVISRMDGEERMSFVPEVGAKRFLMFVEMVREETEKFDLWEGEEGEMTGEEGMEGDAILSDDFNIPLML